MKSTDIEMLEERRRTFDRKRNALLDELSMLTHDQLTTSPAPDRWSLLQVAQHLMLGERDVLQHLPNASRLEKRKRSLRDRVMSRLVLGILRLGIRVKVPAPTMEPDGNITLEEVRHRWDESQSWLKDYIAYVNAEQVNGAVFRHPVSGPLTISQTITLADVHFDSHMRKIRGRLEQCRND